MRALVVVAVLCLGGPAVSCKTATQDRMKALQEAVTGYNEAYRWKNYERAALFLPNDVRAAFIATYDGDEKSLHIEDFQILRVDHTSEDAATVIVRVRFMLLPSVTVEQRMLTQRWHLVNDAWILEVEDNSIREINLDAIPATAGPRRADGDTREGTWVHAEDPEGKVIRSDAPAGEEPLQPFGDPE